jgi:hypothetical protein
MRTLPTHDKPGRSESGSSGSLPDRIEKYRGHVELAVVRARFGRPIYLVSKCKQVALFAA